MASDVDNVIGGPADVTLDAVSIGHTQGGTTVVWTPEQHGVTVDKFGSSVMRYRHTGDQVRVTTSFAEWIATTLKSVFITGRDQVTAGNYVGIGRSAGFEYPDVELIVVPLLTADAGKKITMWRATPIGEVSLAFTPADDRIMEVEFACMGDESKTDGELFGTIALATPPDPG